MKYTVYICDKCGAKDKNVITLEEKTKNLLSCGEPIRLDLCPECIRQLMKASRDMADKE